MALMFIYFELYLRIFVLTILTMTNSLWDLSPGNLLRKIIIRPYLNFMFYFTGELVPQTHVHVHYNQHSLNIKRAKLIRDLWDSVYCVFSIALLLKFFSRAPSMVEMNQHKKLVKNSFLYRVVHHAI
jgi:hypothetical protein